MGFNTVVLVLNDAVHEISKDPAFGKKLAEAIHAQPGRDAGHARYQGTEDVSAGSHCSAATVISSRHADDMQVVAIGGNTGVYLGTTYGFPHDDAGKIKLLKQLAEQMGYSLRKKPSKMPKSMNHPCMRCATKKPCGHFYDDEGCAFWTKRKETQKK